MPNAEQAVSSATTAKKKGGTASSKATKTKVRRKVNGQTKALVATRLKEPDQSLGNVDLEQRPAFKRLTINLVAELHNELTLRAARRGVSLTDLIRRAVALDKFVDENLAGGGRLLIERDGEVREVVLV